MKRIYLFQNVPFNILSKEELIHSIIYAAKHHQKKKVFNMNAYGVVMFKRNPAYAKGITTADIIYPDGWGPVLASSLLPLSLKQRLNVGDFIHNLMQSVQKNRVKIFLIGCETKTVCRTIAAIHNKYNGVQVVGFYHGFFNKNEEKQLLLTLKKTKPNLVLVGMGIPFQELWITKHFKELPPAVYLGIGGVFYYVSGLKSRAPLWMRRCGLEWLFRFAQEPKRLWKRYTIYNLKS